MLRQETGLYFIPNSLANVPRQGRGMAKTSSILLGKIIKNWKVGQVFESCIIITPQLQAQLPTVEAQRQTVHYFPCLVASQRHMKSSFDPYFIVDDGQNLD